MVPAFLSLWQLYKYDGVYQSNISIWIYYKGVKGLELLSIILHRHFFLNNFNNYKRLETGADPGFQVKRGAHKKNCVERREARKLLGSFVWKITILRQKNHIFSNCGGKCENCWGFSCEKSRLYAPPPLDPPLGNVWCNCITYTCIFQK